MTRKSEEDDNNEGARAFLLVARWRHILIGKHQALLLNCIEPYGRDTTVDAHHERRFQNQSSFPTEIGLWPTDGLSFTNSRRQ